MKCFDCEWLDCVGDIFCQYCLDTNCIYTSKEDKELCDMMCGDIEEEE